MNISSEVDEEGDGRGLGSGTAVGPLHGTELLRLNGKVLDGSHDALLVVAISSAVSEVSSASWHVHVVQGRGPFSFLERVERNEGMRDQS